jgi:oxygen-independent coproporphyrinogen-3 oxidase
LPIADEEVIGPELAMGETMMLGLRLLRDGVSSDAFARRHGVSLSERYGAIIQRFEMLGLMERNEDRVRLTSQGALVSNSVLADFLP